MTPAEHKRYLEYLELHGYFGREASNNAEKLSQNDFVALDREYQELKVAKDDGNIDARSVSRLVQISRALHRD